MKTQTTTTTGVERVQALDWEQIGRSLSSAGNAVLSQLLSAEGMSTTRRTVSAERAVP
jgi:hypothetical protein